MGKGIKLVPGDPRDHVASRAWQKLQPESSLPERIEILKRKEKGTVLRLVAAGPHGEDVIAKGSAPTKGCVERSIYEEMLPQLNLPSPSFYGAIDQGHDGWVWLFLEDVGPLRYSPVDAKHRALATRWLAEFHIGAEHSKLHALLPKRGAAHHLDYLRSTCAKIPRIHAIPNMESTTRELLDSIRATCEKVESRWNLVEDLCAHAPHTIVHGDCLAKNIHVRNAGGQLAVLPIDWGGAGTGPAATDLGQLGVPRYGDAMGLLEFGLYHEAVASRWPEFDMAAIASLANLGRMFWALKVISRTLDEFEAEWADPAHTAANLRLYAVELTAACGSRFEASAPNRVILSVLPSEVEER
jgi:thiamine kinase-like enzyme